MPDKHPLSPEKSSQSSRQESKKPRTLTVSDQGAPVAPHVSNSDGISSDIGMEVSPPQAPGAPAWFVSFEQRLEQRFDRLEVLSTTVKEQGEKIETCQMEIEELRSQVKNLVVENSAFAAKLDDLENRSRRMNLVFHGVPEVPSTPCIDVVNDVLSFVGLSSADYSIERCHRTPTVPVTPPPTQDSDDSSSQPKPRMIHVCFASYQQREKVRVACVKGFKGKQYKGKKLFVAEDFSKRIMQLRKNKMEKFKKLKVEGRKPFFLFPDKLAYRIQSTGKLQIVS